MGFTRKRVDDDGKERFMAVYRDARGRVRSAGTYTSEKHADKAWQRAEAKLAEGRLSDPSRGRMKFQRYVEEIWLPNHVMEDTTREGYTYAIYKHILPEFGAMRMIDIHPAHVREWITKLQDTTNLKAKSIKIYKAILSAIFTTAFSDQIIYFHPCRGVKTPPAPRKPLEVITPEQFDCIYQALPDADAQLLVETDIESGLRWGELTELRVKDLNFDSRILTVSRTVVEVDPKHHPEGKRFIVKEYPKPQEWRRFKLAEQIVRKLKEHRDTRGLERNNLLFSMHHREIPVTALPSVPNPEELGMTLPNGKGLQYKHGTISAYNAGPCRCEHCRAAYAFYRATRRAEGKDSSRAPRVPRTDEDGHIPDDWFRRHAWYPAVACANLETNIRIHDLRHAHASWLIAGGANLQVVKERLGHGSIATTAQYLHTLPTADETALTALSNIRNDQRQRQDLT